MNTWEIFSHNLKVMWNTQLPYTLLTSDNSGTCLKTPIFDLVEKINLRYGHLPILKVGYKNKT